MPPADVGFAIFHQLLLGIAFAQQPVEIRATAIEEK